MRAARGKRRIIPFIGFSLLAHLQLVLIIIAVLSLDPRGCRVDDLPLDPIEFTVVTPPSSEPERPKPDQLKKQEEKEKEKEKDEKGQVVDLPPPLEERRPDKARFLSEYDSKVKRETKGPAVPFKPGRLIANRPVRPTPHKPKLQRRVERKVMKLAMRMKRRPELPKSQLKRSIDGQEAAPRQQRRVPKSAKGAKQQQKKGKRITMKDLRLSDSELAKALGTRVNDALKGVKRGKQTLLNSKRWRFASFFNRVKRQVAQNWHPNRAYRRRDPSGNVYGFKDRLTILRVRLTPKGALKGLHLERASGVGFLDDEAINAFKLAQPFPNPPKALVDKKTGMISFRFGFLFEISRRPSFKIFRYR